MTKGASGAVVFHHPLPLSEEPKSGSEVRPVRMLDAFRALGFEVLSVTGFAKERKAAMRRVFRRLRRGKDITFAYCETSTTPTALTQPHHLPTHPFMDFRFLRILRRSSVPIGLFYRDVYWTFPLFAERLPWHKSLVSKIFHRYDWFQFRRLVDHLFLPTLKMRDALHSPWPSERRISALPPGCRIRRKGDAVGEDQGGSGGILRLLYVGGIHPSVYDVTPMLEVIGEVEGVRMTLCCRREEWARFADHYRPSIDCDKVQVVHAHSGQLSEYYEESDLCVDLRVFDEYQAITVPVKLFECLGYGLPSVVTAGTAAAEIVEREGFGWTVSDKRDLSSLLAHLRRDPGLLRSKRMEVERARCHHTWEARALRVAEILSGSSPSGH